MSASETTALTVSITITLLLQAFTFRVQPATLELGKLIASENPLLPTGFQDAITPRWQTRNNVICVALWVAVAVQLFRALPWYFAIGTVLVLFFVGVPTVSAILMPRSMSTRLIRLIGNHCQRRLEEYQARGDKARADAIGLILRRLNSLGAKAASG